MTLDEYVLTFKRLSRCRQLDPKLRALARHLYVCLALDLPSALDARQELLAEAQHKNLKACGPNVPELFEAKLREKLDTYSPPRDCPPGILLKSFYQLLLDLVLSFLEAYNPGFKIRDPFCLCDCNRRNLSSSNDGPFYRYVDLNTLEKHLLFPGKAGTLPVTLQNRREFYSKARLSRLAQAPSLFGLERDHRVSLSKPPAVVNGRQIRAVTFLVPSDSAPHKSSTDATWIASQLGLPEYLKTQEGQERSNQGIAVLRFHPAADDLLYRPTIIDALEHFAFRPGPPDDGGINLFRYGWTRVFNLGELREDDAAITDELGCKEVITPGRSERLPSSALQLEAVCFFES
jgi:hypothetical protein